MEDTIEGLKRRLVTNHSDQEKLRSTNDGLVGSNTSLKKELAALKTLLQKKETDHQNELMVCAQTSHEQGHVAAVEEVKKMWGSKEFAAELMYGENNPKTEKNSSYFRGKGSNSQPI